MSFSTKLIKLRKSNGLSQEELANKINVSRQTVSKWELGVTTPDMEKIKLISDYFGISVDELISETNNNESEYINNKEFIGVDEKYIPKQSTEEANKSYVDKNKKSNKIFLLYLIPIFFLVVIMIVAFVMFANFGNLATNLFDNFFDKSTQLIDNGKQKQEEIDEIVDNKLQKTEEGMRETEQEKWNLINKTQEQEKTIIDIQEEINQFNEKYNYNP